MLYSKLLQFQTYSRYFFRHYSIVNGVMSLEKLGSTVNCRKNECCNYQENFKYVA